MDDNAVIVVVLGMLIVGGLAVLDWIRRVATAGKRAIDARERRHESARTEVEQRILELLIEFPDRTPDYIAQLAHDELVNRRERDPEFFRWATRETAWRIARTVEVTVRRAVRELPETPDNTE